MMEFSWKPLVALALRPDILALVAGFIAFWIVQGIKKAKGTVKGEAKILKRVAAVVSALALSVGGLLLAGKAIDLGALIPLAVLTWLASAGINDLKPMKA